jgi:RimJ/RimL family protein N-acetyltransferase
LEQQEKKIGHPFIEGDSVELCPIDLDNAKLYTKWDSDPQVRRYARNMIPHTIDEIKIRYEPEKVRAKSSINFEVWHKKDKKLIGLAGFNHINWYDRNTNIFAIIGEKDYWGKGIGTEIALLLIEYGFNELNMHKIKAGIFSPNASSLRVAEKAGFKYEATHKEEIYIDGAFVDQIKLSLFKNDWIDSKKS